MDDPSFDALACRLANRRHVLTGLTSLSGAALVPLAATAKKMQKKVTLCLDGQTLHVPRRRRKRLLRKGAQRGACPPPTTTALPTTAAPCIPLGGACVTNGAACCTDVGADATCLAGICRAPAYCTATLEAAGCVLGQMTSIWGCGGVDLSGANLSGCDLPSAGMVSANLSGSTLISTNLFNVDLNEGNVAGVTWGNTTCPTGVNSDDNGNTCCGAFKIGQAPVGC